MTHVPSVIAALAVLPAAVAAQDIWKTTDPDHPWAFPADHWAHPAYQTEWWYFTGHLTTTDAEARRIGYQFTFFRVGIVPERPSLASDWATASLIMGHFALTDLDAGRHGFSEILYRPTTFLGGFGDPGDSLIAWSVAPAGTGGVWTLRWNGDRFDLAARDDTRGITLELSARPTKPLVFHGPGGYSRKGTRPGAASLYYSFTRLATAGVVTMGGERLGVRGESWMDHEFGSNQLTETQRGWDWFSLRLDDGRDLMIYVLRDRNGRPDFALGTLVAPDGTARGLTPEEWTLRATGAWTSDATGARYPSGWTIRVPGAALALLVTPEIRAQENVSDLIPGLFYWEGAVLVHDDAGQAVGRGYVELTGYGTARRPAI
jgi:predicted secreted hydrolase